MGDEVLIQALEAVKAETPAVAENAPPAETPEAAPVSGEEAPDSGGAAPAPEAPAADEAAPPAEGAAAEEEQKLEKDAPKSLTDAWAVIEDRMSRVEKREREMKSREAMFQEEIKKIQSGQIEQQKVDFNAELRRDPLKALADAGVSWHNLATMVMTGQQKVPEAAAEVPDAQGGLTPEAVKQIVAEAVAEAQQQTTSQSYDMQYRALIDTALTKEEYKLMASVPGAKEAVWEAAVRLSHEKNEVLPPETVIGILQEQEREKLQKLMNLDVVKSALGLEVAAPPVSPSQDASSAGKSADEVPETLGAEAGTSSRPDKPQEERKLTEHEILEAALKAVRR